MGTRSLAAYVVAVVIVFAVLNAGAQFFAAPAKAHDIAVFSGGFLLGMLAMYIATRIYR